MAGQNDGHTIFISTILATAEGATSTTSAD